MYEIGIRNVVAKMDNSSGVTLLTPGSVHDFVQRYITEQWPDKKVDVREVVVLQAVQRNVFRYTLETFTEKKELFWTCSPFSGPLLNDGGAEMYPPDPWEVEEEIESRDMFHEGQVSVSLPRYCHQRICDQCSGTCTTLCNICQGNKKVSCTACGGNGRSFEGRLCCVLTQSKCAMCEGIGVQRCVGCHGEGRMSCVTCAGGGNVNCQLNLIVTWTSYKEDAVTEVTSLAEDLNIRGQLIFQDEAERVPPLMGCGEDELEQISKELIVKHCLTFRSERILQQRHQAEVIPIVIIGYEWKNERDRFFVCGLDHRIYHRKCEQPTWCQCVIM